MKDYEKEGGENNGVVALSFNVIHLVSMELWAAAKKLYTGVALSPAAVRVPSQCLFFIYFFSVYKIYLLT